MRCKKHLIIGYDSMYTTKLVIPIPVDSEVIDIINQLPIKKVTVNHVRGGIVKCW